MSERELARIEASAPRRVIGAGSMLGLGAMLLWIAFATPPQNPVWLVFLLVLGGVSLWAAVRLWQATSVALVLTETEFREEDGTLLARLEDVERVERGMLAMKPSNGFNIVLREPGPRAWRPGLWWRLGRKIAVGGVTAGSQTRPVADIILMKLHERSED